MVRFVVTYAYCDWEINGCIGVYDNADEAMGVVIAEALDLWESSGPNLTNGYDDPEFEFRFRHDDANDNYYDAEIIFPWTKEGHADVFRVYYLRDKE